MGTRSLDPPSVPPDTEGTVTQAIQQMSTFSSPSILRCSSCGNFPDIDEWSEDEWPEPSHVLLSTRTNRVHRARASRHQEHMGFRKHCEFVSSRVPRRRCDPFAR